MKKITLYLFATFVLSSQGWAQGLDLEKQYQYSLSRVLDHISRPDTQPGFVIAAPSKSNPNYYYHWVRDAALVMRAANQSLDWPERRSLLEDYMRLVIRHQNTHTLSGFGEPKFNPDGTGYSGPWGRPQNDGPALRASTLIEFANELIDRSEIQFVRDHLYSSALPAISPIKKDLEYTVMHWRSADFDLWEEVLGSHFYTRMAQRHALLAGSRLAKRLGDHGAASWYEQQASHISQALDQHWNQTRSYIDTTLERVGGLDYKYSNLDASVILAVNHSALDGFSFDVLDDRIASSAQKIMEVNRMIYPINSQFEGIGIGRYPEDRYYGGNPWFLLTHAFAEYFYKLAKAIEKHGFLEITDLNRGFYQLVSHQDLKKGRLARDSHGYNHIVASLNHEAESFIRRSLRHVGADGQMDEQFDRHSGFMKSARHLTWSYASFLTMFHERESFLDEQTQRSIDRRGL